MAPMASASVGASVPPPVRCSAVPIPAAVPAIHTVVAATRSSSDRRWASSASRPTTTSTETTSSTRTAAISLPVSHSSDPSSTAPTGGKWTSGRPCRIKPSPANRLSPASR